MHLICKEQHYLRMRKACEQAHRFNYAFGNVTAHIHVFLPQIVGYVWMFILVYAYGAASSLFVFDSAHKELATLYQLVRLAACG